MVFGTLLSMSIPLVLIVLFRRFSARRAWRIAIISSHISLLLVLSIRSSAQFYLSSIISGFHLYFFFLFYNIAHFRETPKEKTGMSSAIMFSLVPAINIAAPLIAGIIAQEHRVLLWIIATLFFLIAYRLVSFQNDFTIAYSVSEAISEIRATRVFIVLQGIWEALIFAVIPIATLFFITTPLFYGTYLAYLSFVSIVANMLLGRYTDRAQKRIVFLYPITAILAIVTFAMPHAMGNITLWIAMTGTIHFLLPLFWNLTTAMVVDTQTNLSHSMPGRELCLALGRITGIGVSLVSFLIEGTPTYLFYFLGSIMILYPLRLYWITRIKKTYSFL